MDMPENIYMLNTNLDNLWVFFGHLFLIFVVFYIKTMHSLVLCPWQVVKHLSTLRNVESYYLMLIPYGEPTGLFLIPASAP